jgi:hypothetical protein
VNKVLERLVLEFWKEEHEKALMCLILLSWTLGEYADGLTESLPVSFVEFVGSEDSVVLILVYFLC